MAVDNILIRDTKKLDAGFLATCDAVAETLGAEGKLAILPPEKENDPPLVTKDGVSVMKHIRFEDKTMNYGALQAIGGALRTLERSGDSTTTTAVFMQGYLRNLNRGSFNKAVERGIQVGVEEVYEHLNTLAQPAAKKDLERIAQVAVNNDKELADKIIQAFDYAEEDGVVECTISDRETTEFIEREGMFLESHGYTSPFFINREDKQVCYEAEDVAVITIATWEYSQKLIDTIRLFYENQGSRQTPLIVFIERPNADITQKLVELKKINFNLCCVACNGYDEKESETLLQDIATLTGAEVYNPTVKDSKIVFGLAKKVVSTLENTSIIVEDVPQEIKDTVKVLESQEGKKDERRIKRLKTKAGVIEVGGINPQQKKEIFDRVEDAIASIKTTKSEGFICGGGATLVHISGLMKHEPNGEERKGYELVKEVLKEPFLRILKNANRHQRSEKDNDNLDYLTPALNQYGIGYNAKTDKIANLIEDGIIDSKKSIRIALESATERAIQMFNIGVIIHYPEKMYY